MFVCFFGYCLFVFVVVVFLQRERFVLLSARVCVSACALSFFAFHEKHIKPYTIGESRVYIYIYTCGKRLPPE